MKKIMIQVWLLLSISIPSAYSMNNINFQDISTVAQDAAQEAAKEASKEAAREIAKEELSNDSGFRNKAIMAAAVAAALVAAGYYARSWWNSRNTQQPVPKPQEPVIVPTETAMSITPFSEEERIAAGAGGEFDATVINFKRDGSVEVITIPDYVLEPNTIIIQNNGEPYATVVQAEEYNKHRDLMSLIRNYRRKLSSSPSNVERPAYMQELQGRLGQRSSSTTNPLNRQPITVLTKDAVDSILYPASKSGVQLPSMAEFPRSSR